MKTTKGVLSLLLLTSALCSTSAHAGALPPSPSVAAVYMDGQLLQLETQPKLVSGTVLIPMRKLFEKQGAELSWNNNTKTVTAAKGALQLSYHVGEHTLYTNGKPVNLPVAGQLASGVTLLPLRAVSETLGSTVKWDGAARTVHIYSPDAYDTTILYGVNLRTLPESTDQSKVKEMLPAGEKIQVVREVDAFWLEVRTRNNQIGYISAKPKYSDYSNAALAERQADALLAYGEKFLGTPYEFGASTDQTRTFDCSSFVARLFKDKLSIDLPRVSYNQAKEGTEVGINQLRKGDLLFFSARGLDIGHVAIYAGDHRILHTYSKTLGVHYETLGDKWLKRFVTARRVL